MDRNSVSLTGTIIAEAEDGFQLQVHDLVFRATFNLPVRVGARAQVCGRIVPDGTIRANFVQTIEG